MAKGPFHRAALARRIRQIRLECYGPGGIEELAAQLELPAHTWANYESGVCIPGLQLLGFIDMTKVDPTWLLTGNGERFQAGTRPRTPDGRVPEAHAGPASEKRRFRI